ncbi:uncharacterized protein [Dendropsophus ebraccatus]|uniref:uncharacterized protein isoform X2 n=1 Tax=Dendropsophus ebraccatus TaxID=150705 RepID=UPI003831161C
MMRILVIGLLYNLRLQIGAAGEPTVRVQLCKDVLDNAVTDSLKQLESSELMDDIGDLRLERPKGSDFFSRAFGKKESKMVPITKAKMDVLPGSEISSDNSFEMTFQVRAEYGDKRFSQNGNRRTQNTYVFMDLEIVAVLLVKVTREKILFSLEDCEVYLTNRDTNLDKSWFQGVVLAIWDQWKLRMKNHRGQSPEENSDLRPGKTELCGIVRRITDIMNANWKDHLIIDPSGKKKLVLKSTSKINTDCLQLNLNMEVGGLEVVSKQRHGVLLGSGVSLLKDYINYIVAVGVHLKELNEKLEKKILQLSPTELQLVIPDVYETDPTNLIISITEVPKLDINGDSKTMTIVADLKAYGLKSEKIAFEVMFRSIYTQLGK